MSGTISILGAEDASDTSDGAETGDRSLLFWRPSEVRYARSDLSVTTLGERVNTFLVAMGEVLGSADTQVEGFRLSEVTVSAEISASGKVSIMGCGGEVGGTGGLEFKFIRS